MSNTVGDSTLPGGTVDTPNQSDSSTQGDQRNSPESDVTLESVVKTLDELNAHVNSLRGDKDRLANKNANRLDKIEERFSTEDLQSYADKVKSGKDDETAMRELRIDHFLQDYDGQQSSVVEQPEDGTDKLAPIVADLDNYFQEFGINPNAPESIAFIRAGKFDPVSKTRFVMENAGKGPSAPSTTMPDGGSGTSVVGETMDSLTEELRRLQLEPTKHIERRREVMEKLKALTPKA